MTELKKAVSGAASAITAQKNEAVYKLLDFSDTQEAEFARRGLIAAPERLELKNADGFVVWSQAAASFLDEMEKAPATVNPSLWENAKNNHVYGLFKVIDGIYQVRGYDMANVTLVAGETGWIVFDTSMSVEAGQAAMEIVNEHLGKRPVRAVIISHPHIDHFGGVKAFVSEEETADRSLSLEAQLKSGKIPIIVPEGFTYHAVSENLYAGTAMGRRASYQYGARLEKSPTGALAIGIGMGQCVGGTASFLLPTWEIKETFDRVTIDGVEIEFQLTPGTEAPAEMNAYLPQKHALWLAENCTGTLHNLYTLRGAQVRDGNAWAMYIMEALARYGEGTEVTFQSHNWPHWGREVIRDYMLDTAATYKYINDETLALANLGYTPDEIAHTITLPEKLQKNWYIRPYYGTVAHNAKAVYQKYLGWYDANPVHLNKLPPEKSAKKWVACLNLGSVEKVLAKARQDYEAGEYQWVAELSNTLLFADPKNEEARLLCADALEQLGYQAEAGTWRNCYLSAAMELRQGGFTPLKKAGFFGRDLMAQLSPEMAFDYLSILMDRQALRDDNTVISLTFTDTQETCSLCQRFGVLLYAKGSVGLPADITVRCRRTDILYLLSGNDETFAKEAAITGDMARWKKIAAAFHRFAAGVSGRFNIAEP